MKKLRQPVTRTGCLLFVGYVDRGGIELNQRGGATGRSVAVDFGHEPVVERLHELGHGLAIQGENICLSSCGLQLAVSGVVTGTVGLLVKEGLGPQIELGWWVLGPAAVAGVILGSRFVLDLLVGPLVGHLADSLVRMWVLGSLAVVGLEALLGLAWTKRLAAITLSAVLFFMAGTGLATVLDSWAGDIAGRAPGCFLPAYNTWQDLGAAVGPTLAYALASRIGLAGTYKVVAIAGVMAVGAFRYYGIRVVRSGVLVKTGGEGCEAGSEHKA